MARMFWTSGSEGSDNQRVSLWLCCTESPHVDVNITRRHIRHNDLLDIIRAVEIRGARRSVAVKYAPIGGRNN